MKKYKLIQEYPGSPILGAIINDTVLGHYELHDYAAGHNVTKLYIDPLDYPKFWQEAEEYEIVSFRGLRSSNNRYLFYLQPKGDYCYGNTNAKYELRHLIRAMELRDIEIFAVKRLSDEEVFTIGDKVEFDTEIGNSRFTIESIFINSQSKIKFNSEHNQCGLSNCKLIKKPLFTTNDGVDMFKGDIYFYVGTGHYLTDAPLTANKELTPYESSVGYRYSTLEVAKEHLLLNKPILTVKEIIDYFENKRTFTFEALKQFAKSRV